MRMRWRTTANGLRRCRTPAESPTATDADRVAGPPGPRLCVSETPAGGCGSDTPTRRTARGAERPADRARVVCRAATSPAQTTSVHAAHAVDRDLLDQQFFFDDFIVGRGRRCGGDDLFGFHGASVVAQHCDPSSGCG